MTTGINPTFALHFNRFMAFSLHFILSLAIFCGFLTIMLQYWYPNPYFEAQGGAEVLTILMGVDVVLGPLITLIIFKRGKPGLKFDLSLVVMVQIAALLYGASIVYQERPVFLVFTLDRFFLLTQKEIDFAQIKSPQLRRWRFTGPVPVYVNPPKDMQTLMRISQEALAGKANLERHPEYYEPLESHSDKMLSKSLTWEQVLQVSPRDKLTAIINPETPQLYAYFPLYGKDKKMIVIFDKQQKKVLGGVDIGSAEI